MLLRTETHRGIDAICTFHRCSRDKKELLADSTHLHLASVTSRVMKLDGKSDLKSNRKPAKAGQNTQKEF